jgi:plasmid stabilization system protein ParE
MRIVVREAAAGDLDDILDWISRDNPQAAAALVRRILARIERLATTWDGTVGRQEQSIRACLGTARSKCYIYVRDRLKLLATRC